MNLLQIRNEVRDASDDNVGEDVDMLWSDTEIDRYINRVYRRIAKETLCIKDATTTSICMIDSNVVDYTTLEAGTLDYIWANDSENWLYQKDVAPYLYEIDPLILRIDEIKWVSRPWKLTKVSVTKWQTNPYWELVVGLPTEYATDLTAGMIALNFRSEEDDTMRLQVRRMPLTSLVRSTDIPEFKISYHDYFINGVLELMYMKQDSQTLDKTRSKEYRDLFLQDLDEIKQQEIGLDEKLRVGHSLSAFR